MTREQIRNAINNLNDSIASLNARLHPPPDDTDLEQQLKAELASAEQSRDALEQLLSNLPETEPIGVMALASAGSRRTIDRHKKSDIQAAIKMSVAARTLATVLLEPVNGPDISVKPQKPKKRPRETKRISRR